MKHKNKKRTIIGRQRSTNRFTGQRKSTEELDTLLEMLADKLEDHSETMHQALLSFALHVGYDIPLVQLAYIERALETQGGLLTEDGALLTLKSDCFLYLLKKDYPLIYEKSMNGGTAKATAAQDDVFEEDVRWFQEHAPITQLLRKTVAGEQIEANAVIVAKMAERRHATIPMPLKENFPGRYMLREQERVDASFLDLSDMLPSKSDLPGMF